MKYPFSSYNTPLPGYGTSLIDRINVYLHFRKYFRLIKDRWLLLVFFSGVGSGLGTWLAMTKPNIFEAKSSLALAARVNTGRSAQIEDDTQRGFEQTLLMMQSGAVMAKVKAKLQEGRDNTNKFIQPDLSVNLSRGNTYVMTVRSTNLDFAQKFARAWAMEFIEYKKRQRQNVVQNTESSMSRSLLEYEADLEKARGELDEFRRRNRIADFRDTGARKRAALEAAKQRKLQAETDRKLLENATREELAAGALPIKGSPSVAAPDSAPRAADSDPESWRTMETSLQYPGMKLELARLEGAYAELGKKLKPKHPAMEALQRDVDQQKRAIEETLRLVDEQRKARIRALQISEQSFEPLIQELQDEVLESTDLENQYESLVRNEQYIKEQMEDLKRRLQGVSKIDADQDVFEPLSLGESEEKPVAPNRPMIITTGLLAGLGVSIGILFLLHRLDDRLESPEAIEQALEEPILGQLPEVDRKHYKEGYLLLTRMKSHTMFAESLRGVRSALLLSPEGTSKRMLAVTSAVPGDGKTTFTTNFAVTLANSGNKTLLIDADLRRGNVHGYFEQPLEGGLSEVLDGKLGVQEAIRETGIKNLFFMRAGERPSNPSELLIGATTKDVIMQLRREFDYVVFDCPPLTAIDDTFSIAAYLDGLMFVVRAGRTSMRFARMSVNTVRQRGAPIIGLIVNGVPIDNPYYYYTTYYYSSYYHRPMQPDENLYRDTAARRGLPAAGRAPAIPAPAGSGEPPAPKAGGNGGGANPNGTNGNH